ncbi:hypothetical protein K438DRAFT_1924922 [Mycena galopus ATCC 62051]|nr:hypothetical protein K438DRAFT_1924922 [Mycena galopus ATCC 62051]
MGSTSLFVKPNATRHLSSSRHVKAIRFFGSALSFKPMQALVIVLPASRLFKTLNPSASRFPGALCELLSQPAPHRGVRYQDIEDSCSASHLLVKRHALDPSNILQSSQIYLTLTLYETFLKSIARYQELWLCQRIGAVVFPKGHGCDCIWLQPYVKNCSSPPPYVALCMSTLVCVSILRSILHADCGVFDVLSKTDFVLPKMGILYQNFESA